MRSVKLPAAIRPARRDSLPVASLSQGPQSPARDRVFVLRSNPPGQQNDSYQIHQTAESHFKWRVALFVNEGFLAAVEIDVDQQQSGFHPRYIEREHSGGMNIEGATVRHQRVPNFESIVRSDPEFITQIARVARARNLNRPTRDSSFCHTKVFETRDVCVLYETLEQAARSWTLQGERGNTFRNVFDLHVHACGVLRKPAQTRIGCGPAIGILFETRNCAVVDHFTAFVAPRCIDHLAHRHFSHIASDDAVNESRSVFTG